MPGLTIAHLAINPEHRSAISADDYLLRVEVRVGIAREPAPPEFDHGGLALDSPAIRSRGSILEHRILGQQRCQRISVVPVERLVEMIDRRTRRFVS